MATFLGGRKGPEGGQSRSETWEEIGGKMDGGNGTLEELTKRHAKEIETREALFAFGSFRGTSWILGGR